MTELDKALNYPSWTWSDAERRMANERRAELQSQMFALVDEAESQDRDLNPDEAERYGELRQEFERLS